VSYRYDRFIRYAASAQDQFAWPESPDFREAAFILGIKSNIVRGLVSQGLLPVAAGYRNGLAKLVPEKEARRFAESYVSTSVLAKRFRLNSGSLVRHLKESGTPLLAIPNPDEGRGHAYFLLKDVAAELRLPTRRMLREESQCRMKADRKKKWAEYRLGQKSATGKPMRRVRANPPLGLHNSAVNRVSPTSARSGPGNL
jgi:hypothetical protein